MNSALSPAELLSCSTDTTSAGTGMHQRTDDSSLVIGTRKSQLAMVQTELVERLLSEAFPDLGLSILGIATTGDKILDVALSKIGTKSLFTKELEVALSDRSVDLVVHSLKDMPTTLPPGMALGATLEREDPRDAVVMSLACQGLTLDKLPPGSVVGTSSVRRSAQLKRRFPDLVFQDVRGNLNTRLRKLDDPETPYKALLLAYAGLHRLGWDDRISEILSTDMLLHAVGQGAIGIECREDDTRVLELLQTLDHFSTRVRVTAERSFMKVLEGGCSVPLGIHSEWTVDEDDDEESLLLKGSVTSLDGSIQVEDTVATSFSASLPRAEKVLLAELLGKDLAELMVSHGARDILLAIRAEQQAQMPIASDSAIENPAT